MVKQCALVCLLAAALAGCATVGPEFTEPAAGTAPAFRHAAVSNDAARLPAAWWTVFGDAALDSLEQLSLIHI